jgi:adenylate cyclase
MPAHSAEAVGEDDLQLLRYVAAVLQAGFPLVAFLQLVRVYGQALGQIADAEIRLFHLYVHEPLMREGVPELEMAEAMEGLVAELLPRAAPIMARLHQRALRHFVAQDVVGHLEASEAMTSGDARGSEAALGRLRVAIAFADLAGYTRLTEEAGEEEALDVVERFVEAVEATRPDDARVVKTLGDEVMVVGADPSALVDWAVGFQLLNAGRRPLPRIGLHAGEALYRDGDYYGRAVNLAARVGARAAGGEVLVTRPVLEAAGPHLEFEPIGEVRLKGFREATDLFLARRAPVRTPKPEAGGR